MLEKLALVFALVAGASAQQAFQPKPGNFPAKGDDVNAGGIFSIPLADLDKYGGRSVGGGKESPSGGQATSGTGPYPAASVTDSSLANHVVFAPKTPPAGNVSMPFIAWGNGNCALSPTQYTNFLVEIASYGYVIAADGTRNGGFGGADNPQSKVQDMRDSIDWAVKGGASKYGNIDLTRISTAGHSCGGLEAMSTAYHDDRVKRILMFDIAVFQDDRRYLLSEIKVPVAWFIGGKSDMGYSTSAKDYAQLPASLPALRTNLDTGHMGTFSATNGGKFGKAAVAYLEWQWRNDTKAKSVIMDKGAGSLVADNFEVEYKGWDKWPGVV